MCYIIHHKFVDLSGDETDICVSECYLNDVKYKVTLISD